MMITRCNPVRDLNTLSGQLNRMFADLDQHDAVAETSGSWTPAVDIYETEQAIEIQADMPGMQETDFEITVENSLLTLSGERKAHWEDQENFRRMERRYGSFSRRFKLPNTVDASKIEARFKDGLLHLTIPKREDTKPKKISINVN